MIFPSVLMIFIFFLLFYVLKSSKTYIFNVERK